jgi:D-lactate dehydrogenase
LPSHIGGATLFESDDYPALAAMRDGGFSETSIVLMREMCVPAPPPGVSERPRWDRSRVVGVIGTGEIGATFAEIMAGFGTSILAADPNPNPRVLGLGATYTTIDEVLAGSDIVSLHCPLTPETHHLIDAERIASMKDGVMLINTSRGALVDTDAVIAGLKSGKIGHLGLDVYEEEVDLFFEDLSDQVLQDDTFARLMTFPNVVITGHQAFFTREALATIAAVTIDNINRFERGQPLENVVVG